MPTYQLNLDSPSLKLTSQFIIDSVELTLLQIFSQEPEGLQSNTLFITYYVCVISVAWQTFDPINGTHNKPK